MSMVAHLEEAAQVISWDVDNATPINMPNGRKKHTACNVRAPRKASWLNSLSEFRQIYCRKYASWSANLSFRTFLYPRGRDTWKDLKRALNTIVSGRGQFTPFTPTSHKPTTKRCQVYPIVARYCPTIATCDRWRGNLSNQDPTFAQLAPCNTMLAQCGLEVASGLLVDDIAIHVTEKHRWLLALARATEKGAE